MPPQDQTSLPQPSSNQSFKTPRAPWVIVALLAIALAVSVVLWKPWIPNIKATDRTVSVTGNATITATPDQYVFSPSYDITSADQQTALSSLAAKSTELVAKLKALGVADSAIKTNSSGYGNGSYYLPARSKGGTYTYTLNITVTINDAALAQKVQNYLITTSPTGDVSPSVDFSTAKKASLQSSARNQAEKDARAKADQSAANLGFRVDQVKSVTDGSLNNNYPRPFNGIASGVQDAATPQLNVQPGQNDLTYSVSVVYYIH